MDTDARFVLLHGQNAQGKTNILEAVHVLATLKSFREPRARRWIQSGEQLASIQGTVQTPHGPRDLSWAWKEGQRQLAMDGTRCGDLQAWFSVMGAVVFCPEDIAIVRGDPARRRQFVDRAAFTLRPSHLPIVQDTTRLIKHKAALLRQPPVDPLQLDTFDAELARLGARLIVRRREAIAALREPFAQMVQEIAGHSDVSLRLRSTGIQAQDDEASLEQELSTAIAQARDDEIARRQVLVGPHRDELEISVGGKQARYFASQGQARTLVLALKLAQWAAAGAQRDPPLFLLDDLNSELDAARRGRLVTLLSTLPGQVWVTTTDPDFLAQIPPESVRSFRVCDGLVEQSESRVHTGT